MNVEIIPLGTVPSETIREACIGLRSVYNCDVTVREEQSIPDSTYDSNREQYRAYDLLESVRRIGTGNKRLGVLQKDIYYCRRNYVFGLATLSGVSCVLSTYRLQLAADGGSVDRLDGTVFDDRVRTEVVHELGHTLGLGHCDNSRCAMSFSPTVREVDGKADDLCRVCRREIEE